MTYSGDHHSELNYYYSELYIPGCYNIRIFTLMNQLTT